MDIYIYLYIYIHIMYMYIIYIYTYIYIYIYIYTYIYIYINKRFIQAILMSGRRQKNSIFCILALNLHSNKLVYKVFCILNYLCVL